MKLLIDSREKWTQPQSKDKHISGYFERQGIEWEVKKLDYGDYMIENGNITIDRKKDLSEVCHNLMLSSDKKRFMNEVRGAKEHGLDFVLLIEHGGKIHSIEDVKDWKNKYSKVPSVVLMNALHKLSVQYNVRVEFCPKISTGRRIIELLQNGLTTDDV